MTKSGAMSSLKYYLRDSGWPIFVAMSASLSEARRNFQGMLARIMILSPPMSDDDGGEAQANIARYLCRTMGVIRTAVDERDADGLTRLMSAAADGAGVRVLRALVVARAEIGAVDGPQGRTALWFAADSGHASVVEELHRLGADLDCSAKNQCGSFNCSSPAFAAALNGHVEVLKLLGQLGADLRRPNGLGRTPMWAASKKGHAAAVQALGVLGAAEDAVRADNAGAFPILMAVKSGDVGTIEALAELGASAIVAPSGEGETPLQVANQMGNATVVAALRRLGAVQ